MNNPKLVSDDVILAYLRKYAKKKGYAPNFEEIAKGVGLSSTSTVKYRLDILAHENKIRITPGIARSVVVLD